MEIRQIRPDEGELVRRARLELLSEERWRQDLLAGEQSKPDAYWVERAERGAVGDDLATLIAIDDGELLGVVDVVIGADREVAELAGAWVEPMRRRSGVGRALTEAAVEWARAHGCATAALWVVETNEPAVGLYKACGFEQAGDPLPIRGCEELRQLYLTRPI